MSGPSKHSIHRKYSPFDDPNDPPALAKALEHISISDPQATHAVFHDKQKRSIKVPRFTTHTVPDVTANTRIVAVVGVQQKVADPQTDGWFLSDFFAFWNVLHGMTATQTWLHCLDLDDLVTRHTRYLYGNPFKERKVVLDAEILAKAKQSHHCPKQIKETLLIPTFHKLIESECLAAKEAGGQSVLILMFGHGDRDTYGIFLGSERNTFSIRMFEKATQGIDVPVTILSTACYSGGWACAPRINATTLTAAGRKDVSKAWTYSGSTARACGSMFTTAIINKMTKAEGSSRSVLDPPDDEPITPVEGEDETYREFAESVFESLLKDIDRRGFLHGLTFSAQDDAWEMHWSDSTGIPMVDFKGRWDELQNWPADETLQQGDFQNRDLHVTAEEQAHFVAEKDGSTTAGGVLGKRKTSGLNGMTPEAMLNKVRNLGMISWRATKATSVLATMAPYINYYT